MADHQLRRILLQRLQSLQRAGVTHLPRPRGPAGTVAVASPEPAAIDPPLVTADPAGEQQATGDRNREAPMDPRSPALATPEQRAAELQVLAQEVCSCTRCPELARTRTQTVFGVGNPAARLCFFGEAPGADEDRQGEPFVGRAGKLLTDIIEKGMGLTRDDVYILNVLKCRPPRNRNPAAGEVDNCREYFERQLATIRPEFICCLGSVAAQNLLQTTQSIGRLRGTLHEYQGIQVVATYHPAYLLRNPAAKKEVWKDIKLLMAEMGMEVPAR